MKKVLSIILAICLAAMMLPLTVFAASSPETISVVLLGNKGTAVVAAGYSESTAPGLVWQEALADGNKVGTDTIKHINDGPFNDTNLKAGYLVEANTGYYINAVYTSTEDYTSKNSILKNIVDPKNSETVYTNGYLTKAILTSVMLPGKTFYVSFAKMPSAISVVLLGNNGTAVVSKDYSESVGLVWQKALVNGNKVGTDTIAHINEGPFNDGNLKAGYLVEANTGYYIDGVYRSTADYQKKNNELSETVSEASRPVYTNGYLTKAILSNIMIPGDTYYISFAKMPTVAKTDNSSGVKLVATANELPENTTLSVEKITSGADFKKVNTILGDSVSGIVAYNISLTSSGVKIQPNGNIKVYLPIPSNFDNSKLTVYYINTENNTKESYPVTVETVDGVKYAVFTTNHFSTYVLAQKANPKAAANPKTDDNSYSILWGSLILITLTATCGLAVYKRKIRI